METYLYFSYDEWKMTPPHGPLRYPSVQVKYPPPAPPRSLYVQVSHSSSSLHSVYQGKCVYSPVDPWSDALETGACFQTSV